MADQCWVGVLLGQFHVEEHDHARYVVHDAFFLPLPREVALTHDGFGGFLGVALLEEGRNYVGDFLVGEELEDAVGPDYDEFVVSLQIQLQDFYTKTVKELFELTWFSIHTNLTSHSVTKSTTHRQSRNVFVLEPDAQRTYRLSILISK